jgi:hypothetical protein
VFAQVYCCKDCAKKKKRKTTQAVKTLFKGEKATLVLVTIKLLHQQTKKAQSERSNRVLEGEIKVKACAAKHQHAIKKGSPLFLTLVRAPLKIEKEKQHRLTRIRRVVSHAIRPASSPPEASRSPSNPSHQIPYHFCRY